MCDDMLALALALCHSDITRVRLRFVIGGRILGSDVGRELGLHGDDIDRLGDNSVHGDDRNIVKLRLFFYNFFRLVGDFCPRGTRVSHKYQVRTQ
jgi:hypothetical protein